MDIHDIPGVNVIETIKPNDDFIGLCICIIIVSFLIAIILFIGRCLYEEYRKTSDTIIAFTIPIGILFLFILIAINEPVKYTIYVEENADYGILFSNYEVVEQKENGFVVTPKDDNKADKYIIEHSEEY